VCLSFIRQRYIIGVQQSDGQEHIVAIANQDWQDFLASDGAQISGTYPDHFGDPSAEVANAARADIIADLSHLSLIRAEGEDVQAFLQGQLSNDVKKVDERHSQLSAYCNPKGRMLAIFRIFRRGTAWYLQLPDELHEATLKRLRMYVLRAKVKLENADAGLVRIGLSGPNAATLLADCGMPVPATTDAVAEQDNISVLRLAGPHPRFELVGEWQSIRALWKKLRARTTPVGPSAWSWLDIAAGIPEILPGAVEEFVPQMANLELVGGVSFNKGCYPGQEIVARMHYLGKLKQRMVRAHAAVDQCPAPGSAVYAPDFPGQSAGTVVNARLAPGGGCDLLLVAQLSSIEKGELHLGNPEGALLQLQELPYSLKAG
jgi:hypothetical protein